MFFHCGFHFMKKKIGAHKAYVLRQLKEQQHQQQLNYVRTLSVCQLLVRNSLEQAGNKYKN